MSPKSFDGTRRGLVKAGGAAAALAALPEVALAQGTSLKIGYV